MITIQSITEYQRNHSTALTLGTFDGVHIGHQKILKKLIKNASKSDLKSMLLTFFPHPRMVLQKDANIKLLNTLDEKTQILTKLGLDFLIIHPFTEDFSRLSATEFVRDLLVNHLKIKKIIIGYDHRFGRNRDANITDLITYGNSLDFDVLEISAQEIDEVSVSSTKIRKALDAGDLQTANKYLGYRYMLTGTIQKGKALGRKLNFPTANLHIPESYKLIPKNGVYVVESQINGLLVYGMMNIGYNPTVDKNPNLSSNRKERIEIHFFDFDNDLYEQKLQIHIINRIRDEHKFDSVGALKNQLEKDKKTSLAIISKL